MTLTLLATQALVNLPPYAIVYLGLDHYFNISIRNTEWPKR